jgi:hypothetical protein
MDWAISAGAWFAFTASSVFIIPKSMIPEIHE